MKKGLLIICALICSIGISSAQLTILPIKCEPKYRGEINLGGAFSNMLRMPPQPDYISMPVATSLSRPIIETVHGVLLSDYLFAGAGVGLQAYMGDLEGAYECFDTKEDATTWGMVAIPMFINIKGFLPINDHFKPFTTLSLGSTIIPISNVNCVTDDTYIDDNIKVGTVDTSKMEGGFYCDLGIGVEYNRWILTLGFQRQRYTFIDERIWYDYEYDYRKDEYVPTKDTRFDLLKFYSNSFYLKIGISF